MEIKNLNILYDSNYYIYQHSINGKVFYIGKGAGSRAVDFRDRSEKWNDFVGGELSSVKVEILKTFDCEEEALIYEKSAIIFCNAYDGCLVNVMHNQNIEWPGGRKKFINTLKDKEKLILYLNELLNKRLFKEEQTEFKNKLIKKCTLRAKNSSTRIGMKTINSFFEENDIPFIVESKRDNSRSSDTYGSRYWILKKAKSVSKKQNLSQCK